MDKQIKFFNRNSEIERKWLLYNSNFKSMANILQNFGFPWGDPDDEPYGGNKISLVKGKLNKQIFQNWKNKRKMKKYYSDQKHPFRNQGEGKAYTYKLFLELGHSLLKTKGRMGLIIPSGIYTDKGTTTLRELLLDECRWEWILGFENKKGIFDIHRSYKFCPIIIEKGSKTEAIKTAFMRHDLSDWEKPYVQIIEYTRDQVLRFSPKNKAILEIRTRRDLEILDKIYSNSVLLGDQSPHGWQIKYAQGDFNMTSDSHLFPPITWWEEKKYQRNKYGQWICTADKKPELRYRGKIIGLSGNRAIPLYEGRMIGQFDFSDKGWVSGKGRTSIWRDIPWENKVIEPQYLMSESNTPNHPFKIGIMDVAAATNKRTMHACFLPRVSCGHSAPTIIVGNYNIILNLYLISVLNSFTFDAILRLKIGGLHLTWNYLEEMPLPIKTENIIKIGLLSARLSIPYYYFISQWLQLAYQFPFLRKKKWKELWAVTNHERLRIRCILDAVITEEYGLTINELKYILRYNSSNPKGFWRVDKDKPQELRHTTLALVAFRDLKRTIEACSGDRDSGIQAFCEQNDGEGWMIPETISFIQRENGVLEFDTPDSQTYEVRSKLGPRFYDWQLEGTPEDSWKECEMHARNILGDDEFEKFMKELEEGENENSKQSNSVQDMLNKADKKRFKLEKEQNKEERSQKRLFDY